MIAAAHIATPNPHGIRNLSVLVPRRQLDSAMQRSRIREGASLGVQLSP